MGEVVPPIPPQDRSPRDRVIEVRATVLILASSDDEADAVLETLGKQSKSWPGMPIVQVRETSRELVEESASA